MILSAIVNEITYIKYLIKEENNECFIKETLQ
jgi:hypothetical protein